MADINRELVPDNCSLVILTVTNAQTYFQTTHYTPTHFLSSPTSDKWYGYESKRPCCNKLNHSLSTFLIGQTFVGSIQRIYLVVNWANFYFLNIVGNIDLTVTKIYIQGPKGFAQQVLGIFALFDELLLLAECQWSTLISCEQRALLWMRKKEKMDDGIARYFTQFRLVGGAAWSLGASGTQNDIVLLLVVSWITPWWMIKVYWLDFSLHFGITLFAALLPQVQAEACISLYAS